MTSRSSAGVERRRPLLARYGGRCVWCASPLAETDRHCTVEHLIPKAHGGTDELANLAPACRGCNHRRGRTAAADWAWLCERRGMRPNRRTLAASLHRLATGYSPLAARARRELRALASDHRPRWATAPGTATVEAPVLWGRAA